MISHTSIVLALFFRIRTLLLFERGSSGIGIASKVTGFVTSCQQSPTTLDKNTNLKLSTHLRKQVMDGIDNRDYNIHLLVLLQPQINEIHLPTNER